MEITTNSCVDTSSCYELKATIAPTDLSDYNAFQNVRIFPTVGQGEVNIVLPNVQDVSISIFNLQGQLVYFETHVNDYLKKINLESTAGIYFIEISNSQGKEVFRFIKK